MALVASILLAIFVVPAPWRVPVVLFISMGGMAFGSWFAGLLYDSYGFYAPAFAVGAIFNLANLVLLAFLVIRQRATWHARRAAG